MKQVLAIIFSVLIAVNAIAPPVCIGRDGNKGNAGKYLGDLRCILDKKVTVQNWGEFLGSIPQLWGYICGLNRGIFTLNTKDDIGHTYSCGNLPQRWGIGNNIDAIRSLPPDRGIAVLNEYIEGVFNTSSVKNGCEYNGFGYLYCGEERQQPWKTAAYTRLMRTPAPLRGVNIGGLFVLEPWITPELTSWNDDVRDQYTYSQAAYKTPSMADALLKHWATFYTQEDFNLMAQMGLNSIRLPVGWWYYAKLAHIDPAPYLVPSQDIMDPAHPINLIVSYAQKAGLLILLDLHGSPASQNGLDNSGERSMDPNAENWGDTLFYNDQKMADTLAVLEAMTRWVTQMNRNGYTNLFGIELLNEPWVFSDMSIVRDFYYTAIEKIRAINPTVSIFVHDAFRHDEWNWLFKNFNFDNIYMDTHLYHAFNMDDIGSSSYGCDRLKITIHENIACGYGGILRFKTCSSLPTFVGEWSLATEDCQKFLRGSTTKANQFRDIGQCLNINQRLNGPEAGWWIQHYRSFSARQMTQFERELGWTFWTWKLGAGGEKDPSTPFWSFKDAVARNLIDTSKYGSENACKMQANIEGGPC